MPINMDDSVSTLTTANHSGQKKRRPMNGSEKLAALVNLRATADKFVACSMIADASRPTTMDLVASHMHAINHCVFEAEAAGAEKAELAEMLARVRDIQASSPFVSRLQRWPRGYAGDFETVEYLMKSVNRADPDTVAFWIEEYCLNTAVAQQHRNKVRWQSEQIERTINECEKAGRAACILMLACGSSPDVRMCLERIVDKDFQIVLSDMDAEALDFSAHRLAALGDRLKTVPGNMFRQINKFAADGPFDLVLAGGLFDYLKDDQAAFLIKAVTSKLLASNGKFAFTNIAKPNPYRIWMEYCASWFLIERNDADFRHIFDGIGGKPEILAIQKEASGLSLLIEIQAEAKQ